MDEQRLPFPIHGTRLTGDGVPQRGVGEAARLLYFANLIAQTAGVPVYRLSRQTPYGQVTASVHGPLAFKSVQTVAEPPEKPPEEEGPPTRLVWLPEGFVITPRTAEAPEGYGMPPTWNGRGTPDGPLIRLLAPGCMMMISAAERSIWAVKPLPMPMKTPVIARTRRPDRARAMTAAI